MLFKVDESLHDQVAQILREAGHDAETVHSEGLQGHGDDEIAEVCRNEKRSLVTLDLDFANIQSYPQENHFGLIVLRIFDQSRPSVETAIRRIASHIDKEPLCGALWIVEESRIRIFSPNPPP